MVNTKIIVILGLFFSAFASALEVENKSPWVFNVELRSGNEKVAEFRLNAREKVLLELKRPIMNPHVLLKLLSSPFYQYNFSYPWKSEAPIRLGDRDKLYISKDPNPVIIRGTTGIEIKGEFVK